ncbi:hypothetical protein [Synoicihabitans lomoniglobus]|uniref:Carboxymuconolactone decarboxylase family protein n=1 Tax=Synoicihabitans lomoniglobus TaxID=2909285 RepID=A0AAE9ZVL6_9BACT|nr:hypothetical protein [Opitutaceae bacterium LMO-M01]WED64917.1 hypothetical protein PXH66_21430 [Opitutaceae bacterium LMO-M01]
MTSEQIESARAQTHAFRDHYNYDTTYMEEMLDASPAGFARFQAVTQMAGFGDSLPKDVPYVARIAAFAVVDCGPCLELTLKMGREAGVAASVLHAARCDGAALPAELAEVRGYAAQIAAGETPDDDEVQRLRDRYGSAGLVELALNIASSLIFPAVKRTLGHARSCSLTTFSV